ncbi:MAG: hypothetical protein CVU81_02760 [Euryarchaeota archaeon HGW-Euryarchaeota-1]|nr:MAG: hypothetical protein CVU81_02760 [Euryarchaeota archaeon HGW-Euryarchaeota-1]
MPEPKNGVYELVGAPRAPARIDEISQVEILDENLLNELYDELKKTTEQITQFVKNVSTYYELKNIHARNKNYIKGDLFCKSKEANIEYLINEEKTKKSIRDEQSIFWTEIVFFKSKPEEIIVEAGDEVIWANLEKKYITYYSAIYHKTYLLIGDAFDKEIKELYMIGNKVVGCQKENICNELRLNRKGEYVPGIFSFGDLGQTTLNGWIPPANM